MRREKISLVVILLIMVMMGLVWLFFHCNQLPNQNNWKQEKLQLVLDRNVAVHERDGLKQAIERLTKQLLDTERELAENKKSVLETSKSQEDTIKNLQEQLKLALKSSSLQNHNVENHSPPIRKSASQTVVFEDGHKLGIVVPFRDAMKELQQFVPHMNDFLKKQKVTFEVIVVDQMDEYRFNRGALLNIGVIEALRHGCDYVALHDVDLLPLNDKLDYSFPKMPMHISAPFLHPIYHYKTFIGGILLLSIDHFRLVNGLSTHYWGWGREDDELYKRIIEKELKVIRPPENIATGTKDTFRHIHDADVRVRDMMKVGDQEKIGRERDAVSGLSTTKLGETYTIQARRRQTIGDKSITMVDVKLICDEQKTPWCLAPTSCKAGFFKKAIKDDPKGRWVCTRCGTNCWQGFVLVGKCEETSGPVCKKIGRDISEEEAKQYPEGTIIALQLCK